LNLCLFDLDQTLLPTDSDHAWGQFIVEIGWMPQGEYARHNQAFFAQYEAGKLDIDAYVEFVTGPLRQRSADELMQEVINPQLRPAALDLVRLHQAQGDLVALVTATNDFISTPIAKAFGIEHVLATELERDPQGAFTGRIAGVPNYREGKVTRVGQWLAGLKKDWQDHARISVYSDSTNDLPLLEQATDAVATNPSPALEAIARERGWRVLKLFESGLTQNRSG
jgi:HAD superfamily hydrolase (TIGR01490 family)